MEKQLQKFRQDLLSYMPGNEQEEQDKQLMLHYLDTEPDLFTRNNPLVHFTASGWIVNPKRSKVLMVYHNIYDSWSWTGGHADGEMDLLAVAMKEGQEETGAVHLSPISRDIFSIEALTVDGHVKRGKYVSSHIHLNVTYLLQAEETDTLIIKPDENSGVQWIPVGEIEEKVSEPWMMERIYRKLLQRMKTFAKESCEKQE